MLDTSEQRMQLERAIDFHLLDVITREDGASVSSKLGELACASQFWPPNDQRDRSHTKNGRSKPQDVPDQAWLKRKTLRFDL